MTMINPVFPRSCSLSFGIQPVSVKFETSPCNPDLLLSAGIAIAVFTLAFAGLVKFVEDH